MRFEPVALEVQCWQAEMFGVCGKLGAKESECRVYANELDLMERPMEPMLPLAAAYMYVCMLTP